MKHRILNIGATIIAGMMTFNAVAITGNWKGEISYGPYKIPLVFNFSEDQDGKTDCTLDSPSQGVRGLATEVTKCTTDSVIVECKMIGATFSALISQESIDGTFQQRGASFPLTLTQESSIEERRPQTPKPPYPYTSIDTTFIASDGIELSATLTLPPEAATGKIPAVILITGSGPQNRDEELFDHKPFAVISDYLARHGVASLRYDDRGVGQSKGDSRLLPRLHSKMMQQVPSILYAPSRK